ncbi:MAG TPA: SMC-Scp complex subunit ScpB [Terracidiphilus sp.]|nr:SMC-Scp complex subunit ScpB [Terracidiphilus sp.]
MSLKAKLEAVIYAAEEPVTLAQLALLFTADALEWKAEQEAAAAELAAEAADLSLSGGETLTAQNGEFDYLAMAQAAAEPEAEVAPVEKPALETTEESDGEPASASAEGENSTVNQADDENAEVDSETASSDEAAAAASLRREARLRDREVRTILRQLLDELIAEYTSDNRGVEIREIAGGYRMATKPECHDAVRAFVKSLKPALKLSLPALETLAVIAYKQPVTAPEVNEIRGVDSSGVFGSLLARKLIATAGRKPVIGRPILYKTTKEFLLRFGLKDVTELPSMEEFEKMAAIELDEPEMDGPGESAPEIKEDLRLEIDDAEDEDPADEPTESPDAESASPESESTTLEAAPAAPPSTE